MKLALNLEAEPYGTLTNNSPTLSRHFHAACGEQNLCQQTDPQARGFLDHDAVSATRSVALKHGAHQGPSKTGMLRVIT
ncbi:hypothetical protein [Bradyrhizobium sp. USDA 4506]